MVGEQRLWQLPEVQLERSCDGVDVHVTQHHQDIFGIYRREKAARRIANKDRLKTENTTKGSQ